MSGVSRWILAAAICWCLFSNHYARDVTGALEREIESELNISPESFQALNSVYFAPNLIAPFLYGALSQRFGALNILMAVYIVAALGHVLVGLGVQLRWYAMLLVGRGTLGITYESIDVSPFPILAPLFSEDWALLVGIFSSCLRLGSVVNFVISPVMYTVGGLTAGLWMASAVGLSGFFAAVAAHRMAQKSAPSSCESNASEALEPGSSSSLDSPSRGTRDCRMFLLYATIGALLYSAIVPFWFWGGAFLRKKWGYTLHGADALMLLTEGGMVVLSPPLGCLVDGYIKDPVLRMGILAGTACIVPISMAMLAFMSSSVTALLPMLLLSIGYAATNFLFWSLSAELIPKDMQSLGAGIVGSALNLGATVLPVAMAKAPSDQAALMFLAIAAIMAVAMILLLAILFSRRRRIVDDVCREVPLTTS